MHTRLIAIVFALAALAAFALPVHADHGGQWPPPPMHVQRLP